MADVDIDGLPGIEAADAELQRMMAEDNSPADAGTQAATTTDAGSAASGQRAAQPEKPATATDATQSDTNTPAAAEAGAQAAKTTTQNSKPQEPASDPKAGEAKTPSRFAKAQARAQKSWDEINQGKAQIEQDRQTLAKEREEFQRQRDAAEQTIGPEDYDTAAKQFDGQAKALEAQGQFEAAEEKKALARMARNSAAKIRANPKEFEAAKQRKQAEADKVETERKEWTLKAGMEYPDLAKDNSALQIKVAQILQAEPQLKAQAKGMYWAVKMASAELAAAGVPVKDKELARLGARVKELEILTSPGGAGSASALPGEKPFEQKSDDEKYADLERQALEVGAIR